MEYQLVSFAQNGNITDNGDGTKTIPIIITPGIVGDTYGFVAPNPSKNMTNVTFPSTGMDANQIDAFVAQKAAEFCATQYPNT